MRQIFLPVILAVFLASCGGDSNEPETDATGRVIGSQSKNAAPAPTQAQAAKAAVEEVKTAELTPRMGHQAVSYKGKLWIIGGDDGTDKSDVWSSKDGVNWQLETADAGFPPRSRHQAVVFERKLWVIMGLNETDNDFWSSVDGKNWVKETPTGDMPARWSHQVKVFDKKLWIVGGDSLDSLNDVWSSRDGLDWTQVTASAEFSPRYLHQVLVYNDKLWLIGGYEKANKDHKDIKQGDKNDVWSSVDGQKWTKVTDKAAFSARSGHQALVFNNKMWVIGGDDGSFKNDVWSSTDGVKWTQETASAAFSPRKNFKSLVFKKKLWVIGGFDQNLQRNDIWSSEDGVKWVEQSTVKDAAQDSAGSDAESAADAEEPDAGLAQ